MSNWTETEPKYDFQSAQWVDEESGRRVVIENVRGEQPDLDDDLFNVRVLGPESAYSDDDGRPPQHEVATEVSERAAHEAALDYMGEYPTGGDPDM